MGNIHELPDRETIEHEASAWLVRLDSERRLEPEELDQLRTWMQRSPSHREELLSLSEFWGDQSLTALPIPLERLCYDPTDKKTAVTAIRWQSFQPQALAALLVMAIGIALVVNTSWLTGGVDQNTARYATAIGQQRSITLPDGSILHLNTNSQVKIDYSPAYRNVKLLQGEAYFDVAKQPERPFRVYAGRGRVQAVGTAFTVFYRNNNDVDVVVTEGTVALGVLNEKAATKADEDISQLTAQPAKPIQSESSSTLNPPATDYYLAMPVNELGLLEAGQETTILLAQDSKTDGKPLDSVKTIAQSEIERRGAWRSGLLVFSGNSLEEVVAEISRYTTLSIDIVEPDIKQLRIGGRFSVDNTRALFNALEANFGLKVTQLDLQRIEISSSKKNKNDKNK